MDPRSILRWLDPGDNLVLMGSVLPVWWSISTPADKIATIPGKEDAGNDLKTPSLYRSMSCVRCVLVSNGFRSGWTVHLLNSFGPRFILEFFYLAPQIPHTVP